MKGQVAQIVDLVCDLSSGVQQPHPNVGGQNTDNLEEQRYASQLSRQPVGVLQPDLTLNSHDGLSQVCLESYFTV